MKYATRCPHCQARFRNVPSAAEGTKYTCPRCKKAFTVRLDPVAAPQSNGTTNVDRQPPDGAAAGAQQPPRTRVDLRERAAVSLDEPPPATRVDLPADNDVADEVPATRADWHAEDGGANDVPATHADFEGAASDHVPQTRVDHQPVELPESRGQDGRMPGTGAVPPTRVDQVQGAQVPGRAGDEEELWRPGEILLGTYEVLGTLGRGGMGVVYRVRHLGWGTELAVKTPLRQIIAVQGGAEAFIREAETWVSLGLHPNIVSCFYVRNVDQIPRVFAEFVEGGSLLQWIRQRRLSTVGQILDVAIQLAWGLGFAHESGLVHQDVKPANVLLSHDMVAKVTDFGLARVGALPALELSGLSGADTDDIMVSAAGMTPGYCSPEQQAGDALGIRSDLWSWAVSVLEMFTGKIRWRSGAVAAQALAEYWENGPYEEGIPRMPGSVRELLEHCFQKDPEARPPSMSVVADRLAAIYQDVEGHEFPRRCPEAGRDRAESLNNRAVSLLDLGRREEAEALWEKALRSQAHHIESTYNTVVHAWKKGGIGDDEVLRKMQELQKTQVTSARDEHLLGRVYMAMAHYEQALQCFNEALEEDSQQGEIVRDRSLALCGLAAQRDDADLWSQARQSLEAVVELGRTDAHVVVAYAASMQHTGPIELAGEVYQEQRQRFANLPASLDEALAAYLPRSEIAREWQPFAQTLTSARLSSDGRFMAAIGDGHRLILVQCRTGKVLLDRHEPTKQALALALSPDDRQVLIASEGENLQLWDLESLRRVHSLQPHQGTITDLAFTSDGGACVAASTDRRVRWWDPQSREILCTVEGHEAAVTAVSGGRGCIVSGSLDGTVRVWDRGSGVQSFVLTGHTQALRSVALSADDRRVLSGGDDGDIRLWDLDQGQVIRVFRGHPEGVTGVAFTNSERQILSTSRDGSLRLWDVKSGMPVVVTRRDGPLESLSVARLGDAALVVGGSSASLVHPQAKRPFHLPYAVSVPVSAVEAGERSLIVDGLLEEARKKFDAGQPRAAFEDLAQARDQPGFERDAEVVDLWCELAQPFPRAALRGAWEVDRIDTDHNPVSALALGVEREHLVLGHADGTVRLFNGVTRENIQSFAGHEARVSSVAMTIDGEYVLSAGWDGVVMLSSVATGDAVRVFEAHAGPVLDAAPSLDYQHLLAAGEDGSLRVFRLESPEVNEVLQSIDEPISCSAISPDGRFALAGSWDASLCLWDLYEQSIIGVLQGHEIGVRCVDFSPDGATALSGGADHQMYLWDLRTGRRLRVFEGHGDEITKVRFSPDGGFGASSSKDGTIRIWDLKQSRCLRHFEVHKGRVNTVLFSHDGTELFSAGRDATLRRWSLDWDPDIPENLEWDDRARGLLELFLVRAPLQRRQVELTKTVTRIAGSGGTTRLKAEDLLGLYRDLENRGFGWLTRPSVAAKLGEIAKRWDGWTTVSQAIVAADREALPRAWRQRQRRKPVKASTVAMSAIAGLFVVIGALAFVVGRVPYDPEEMAAVREEISAFKQAEYDGDLAADCRADDRDLYLEWVLDPRESNREAITCMCRVAGPQDVNTIIDRLRSIHRKFEEDPGGILDLPERRFLKIDSITETKRLSYRQELERMHRLVRVLAMTVSDEVAASLFSRLIDSDPEVRSAVAEGLASRSDQASIEAVVTAANHDDPKVRESVAKALPRALSSGQLSGRKALRIVETLCADPNPEIRRSAVQALPLFDSSDALRLANELAADSDEATAVAAEHALDGMID